MSAQPAADPRDVPAQVAAKVEAMLRRQQGRTGRMRVGLDLGPGGVVSIVLDEPQPDGARRVERSIVRPLTGGLQ